MKPFVSMCSKLPRRVHNGNMKNILKFSVPAVAGQKRCFSLDTPPVLQDIDHRELIISTTRNPKQKLRNEELKFGNSFTDHMLEIDWNNTDGWKQPKIVPHHALSLDPAASSLHYALQCFEGMKAYRDPQTDQIRMFRPMLNMERMNFSCESLFMPTFSGEEFLECIKDLLRTDNEWIPKGDGFSLYIRPTMISTHPFLGVGPAAEAKLYVILSPVGPYYPEGFAAVKLLADKKHVRAWPGGTGNAKVGGNYGPTIRAQMQAVKMGYTQVLWLFGEDLEVTEVGTMNQFFFWINKEGKKELITAPLDDGTILPGVTRRSILELCREMGEFEVTERVYGLQEVIDAIEEGRMLESFGSGTAAVISPVKGFHYDGKDYAIPLDPSKPDSQAGPLAQTLWDKIIDIQYGKVPHEWSVVV